MSKEIAARIWATRRDGGLLPKSALSSVKTRRDAYVVQDAAVAASGMTRAGWKVAATSAAAMDLLGVPGPIIGPVFEEQIWQEDVPIPTVPDQATAIECEFSFVMDQDLPGHEVGRDEVAAAVRHMAPAIEVVGCRFEGGFKGAGEIVVTSDFAFNAGLVFGAAVADWRGIDLKAAGATLALNGKDVAKGAGAAVLGDPVEALLFAANEAVRIGRPLRAGEVVTTGTMTGATLVKPGDRSSADFGPLGRIDLTFA